MTQNEKVTTKEVFGIKEVVNILGKSKSWVYKYKDQIGFIKIGKSYFICEDDFYERIRVQDKQRQKVGLCSSIPKEAFSESGVSNKRKSKNRRATAERRFREKIGSDRTERDSFFRLVHNTA